MQYNATVRRGSGCSRARLLSHFLDKVRITRHCWLWIGYLNLKGYGLFFSEGKNIKAHRFSYEFFVGPIEPGKMVLHKRECNERSCVNPNHLYMGTHNDNVRDRELWGIPASGIRPIYK